MPPIPTLAGETLVTASGSSSSFTVDPTANVVNGIANTGDYILLVGTSAGTASTTKSPTPPGDWTTLVPFATVGSGTMSFGLWAHRKLDGETTYSWSQTTSQSNGFNYRLVFVRGGDDVSNWTQGAFDYRQNTGTTTTNVAASITTTVDNSLALLISAERTIATETSDQVTCTNFTKQYFENTYDQSTFYATKDMSVAGSTGSSTITYPNPHNYNGIAGILGIPPYDNAASLMWTT